jgi:hypothetical protein
MGVWEGGGHGLSEVSPGPPCPTLQGRDAVQKCFFRVQLFSNGRCTVQNLIHDLNSLLGLS